MFKPLTVAMTLTMIMMILAMAETTASIAPAIAETMVPCKAKGQHRRPVRGTLLARTMVVVGEELVKVVKAGLRAWVVSGCEEREDGKEGYIAAGGTRGVYRDAWMTS